MRWLALALVIVAGIATAADVTAVRSGYYAVYSPSGEEISQHSTLYKAVEKASDLADESGHRHHVVQNLVMRVDPEGIEAPNVPSQPFAWGTMDFMVDRATSQEYTTFKIRLGPQGTGEYPYVYDLVNDTALPLNILASDVYEFRVWAVE